MSTLMYKYNSNFGSGSPIQANWADLGFGFLHSRHIEQNYNVFCDWETKIHHK